MTPTRHWSAAWRHSAKTWSARSARAPSTWAVAWSVEARDTLAARIRERHAEGAQGDAAGGVTREGGGRRAAHGDLVKGRGEETPARDLYPGGGRTGRRPEDREREAAKRGLDVAEIERLIAAVPAC